MKKTLTLVLVFAFVLSSLVFAEEYLKVDPQKYINEPGFIGYVQDRFVVVLKDNIAVDHAKDARSNLALTELSGFEELANQFRVSNLKPQFPGSDRGTMAQTEQGHTLARYYKVTIGAGSLEEAMAAYEANPMVDHVEPIGIHTLRATPNDGYYDDPPPEFPYDQWHYWDTYGIEADMAWDDETGSQTVIVGDLDIGCKYDHGDLGGSDPPGPNDAVTNGNIWVNTNEIPGNGVDDDGNGYTDDVIGWDFVDRTDWYIYSCVDADCGGADNDPFDGDGHGTHTAGTIAAITNNGYAVAGVAGGFGDGTFAGGGNGVKVVPCRIGYDLLYQGQTVGVVIMDYVAEAMYYMAELKINGWNVAAINCSFGTSNSGGLGAACDYLVAQDVMVIVAAGNSNSSSADYLGSRTDCMDVGATDQSGNPASFSNYGSWVDVAAPGVSILSTITDPSDPASDYVSVMDGTSMACPHVVGVAALLESYDPSLTAQDKWDLIVNNTKAYNMTKYVGAGIVDVRACLDALGPQNDPPVADFSGSPTSGEYPLTVNFTDLSTNSPTSWSWDFGDGVGTSTAQNPSYTFTTEGVYTVTLTATNAYGSDDEIKTDYITVTAPPPPPVAEFVGSPISGDFPLNVSFTDQSTNSPTSWSWDFGDGGMSTSQNPLHTYTAAGTYTVTLTATNAYGSDDEIKTDYITVTAPPPPVAAFVGSPLSGDYPLTVDFTDQSTGTPTSWSWDFGDGGTSTAQNPSYTYNSAGTYTVSLTVTNVNGSDDEVKTDYITVTCPDPVADFSGTPTSGNTPLSVNFTDLSTGSPASWNWDFGDGGTSTVQNPSYSYTSAGTYTVSLSVTNACGSDQEIKTDYITVTDVSGFCDDFGDGDISDWTILSGDWTVSGGQLDGYIASDRAFIMSPLGDISDATITVDWTSLSGGTWTNGIVVFGYVDGSNYRVADFRDGANKWYIREFIGGTQYNRAQFAETINTNQQYAMEVIIDPSGLVTIKADGVEKVSYNFGSVQTGQVGLEVNQSHSQFDNFCVDAEAPPPPPPVAAFVGSPTSGNYPLTVNFTDQSTESPTSWSWNFGDGGTSTAQNPSHTYTAAGTYTVTLTATNAYGSDDEVKTDYITVTSPPPPVAAFVGSPTSGDYPLTVDFTDQSTNSPTAWSWDFGDGGTSTAQNPSYTYNTVGTYTVTLTATNAYGSDDEIKTDYITVTDPGSGTWHTITYDDFEAGWGSYSDGGGDCSRYTGGTYAHQGNAAILIRDNSGTASSFYHTSGYDVSGYTDLEVEFWYYPRSMDNTNEDFWLQYYDGSTWQTVETWARGIDFENGSFYHEVVTIPSGTYNYPTNAQLRFMCDASGNRDYVYIDEVEFRGFGTGVSGFSSYESETQVPKEFSLTQNYPNPFNPTTTISFNLKKAAQTTLTIYNVMGQEVATLIDRVCGAGQHRIDWDASGNASGIYFYRLTVDNYAETKKMVLLK